MINYRFLLISVSFVYSVVETAFQPVRRIYLAASAGGGWPVSLLYIFWSICRHWLYC
jgi:hypothetical protein